MILLGSRLLALWLGLAVGNFLYQLIKQVAGDKPNYWIAVDRSFFQGAALVVAWLCLSYFKD